jgi:hypothetical protein
VRISVLGRMRVDVDGVRRPLRGAGQRQMVALLVAAGPEGISPDLLADELWHERLPPSWPSSLRNAIRRLRQLLGPAALVHAEGRYRLDRRICAIDAWEVLSLSGHSNAVPAHLLEVVPAFPEIEPSPLIVSAARQLDDVRLRILDRRLSDGSHLPTPSLLASLRSGLVADPTDTQLALVLARALLRCDRGGDAMSVLDGARQHLIERGLETTRAMRELEVAILSRADGGAGGAAGAIASQQLPGLLRAAASSDLVGRSADVDAVLAHVRSTTTTIPVLLVEGERGIGKTRLVAEVALQRAAEGAHVLHGPASRLAPEPFGPLVAALPDLAAMVVELSQSRDDDAVRRLRFHAAARDRLVELATYGPVLLVLDGLDAADEATLRFVDYLVRTTTHAPIALVVEARSGGEEATWQTTRQSLLGLPTVRHVPVGPLTTAELTALVDQRFPAASLTTRRHLVDDLAAKSCGVPGLTMLLVDAVDPVQLTLPAEVAVDDRTAALVTTAPMLDGVPHRVGVAAAVIGRAVGVDDLVAVTGLGADVVADAVDVLLDRGDLVETEAPGRFTFRHDLARSALTGSVPAHTLRRLHRAAAELSTSLHERAHHYAAAVPLVDREPAVQALLASATAHFRAMGYRDAVVHYRRALELDEHALDVEALITYSVALGATGALGPAAEARRAAIAIVGGDPEAVVRIAVSGLPLTERPAGDDDRLGALLGIDPVRLGPRARFDRAMTISRQAALTGDRDVAEVYAGEAAAAASGHGERVEAALARMFLLEGSPYDRLQELEDLRGSLDDAPALTARIEQWRALDLFRAGRPQAGGRANRAFRRLAERLQDPVRIWQSMCYDATRHHASGEFAASTLLSSNALELARRHGIQAAASTFLAQRFFELWLLERSAELAPLLAASSTDAGGFLAFDAARAVVLAATGDGEAPRLVAELVRAVARRPTAPSALSAACLLADVVGGDPAAPSALVDALWGVLAPHAGTVDLLGAGVVSLGPVDRYIGLLHRHTRGVDVSAALSASLRIVERRGLELWRLVVTRDLLRWGDQEHSARAARLLPGAAACSSIDSDVAAAIVGGAAPARS